MDYLELLGIGSEEGLEKKLAGHLVSRNEPKEYNPDLDLDNYLHFLKIFSEDRSKGDYVFHLTERLRGDLSVWDASYKIDRMLTILFHPVQNIEKIRERQSLLRRYISSQTGEEDRDLSELTKDLMHNHHSLYKHITENISRIDLSEIASPFVKTVESLARFRNRFDSDPQLKYFTERIDNIFKNNPITEMAVLLEQGGVVIMGTDRIATKADLKAKKERRLENEEEERERDRWGTTSDDDESKSDGYEFWLARSEPIGKGIFDLGKFEVGRRAKMKDYPNQEKDISSMLNFAYDSAVLVYTLVSMEYQADIYNRMKRLGLPVCIPELNDEGRFRVKNGHPIATTLKEEPAPVNLSYDKTHRKFIVAGAHSGGKSELLKNLGLYHIVGVGGGVWPADEGEVPLTTRVITSIKKRKEESKGSLESELKDAMEIARNMGPRDLALIDEFLDTTKPELARHISYPLLIGEEGLCVGFAKNPGTVYIVDHRASFLREDMGFEFMYPVLKRKKVVDLVAKIKSQLTYKWETNKDLEFFKSLKNKTVLVPTHTFAVGKPNPSEVREHALQIWQRVLWDASHKEKRFSPERGDYEPYSSDMDDTFKEDSDKKRGYVTWQVPGRIGGIWVNNPNANKMERREMEEQKEEKHLSRWEDDEVVIDDPSTIDEEEDYSEEDRSDEIPF